jgi:beta-galactosidase/beta-glucuronidase
MRETNFCDGWHFKHQGVQNAELINLPHDAMIHEKREPQNSGGSAVAFFSGGIYEYEKTFFAPEDWADKTVSFRFEGVYKNSTVYINGREAGGCAYGYSQFYVHAKDALEYGKDNVIRVIVCNDDQPNSRWYTGSGIYRPVWLLLSEKNHIDVDGVKISTLSYNPAKIRVNTSHTGGDTVLVEVQDNGRPLAKGQGKSVELEIPDAKLWSDTTPNLYQCRVTLLENGVSVDEATEIFGIRLVEWSTKGLFINGEETLLRGGCIHHDNGILGACSYAKSEERRVRMLKDAGFNAIRSAHNPASTATLEACDRLGMYVIDETWDMWYNHKSKNDYAGDFEANYQFDIKSM